MKLLLILGILGLMLASFVSADIELTDCMEINSSDRYYLTNNLITNQALENCFEINADDVTIDCGYWEITNINTEDDTTLFYVASQENVNIEDCFITNFNTGVYVGDVLDSKVVNTSYRGFTRAVEVGDDFDGDSKFTISRNSFLDFSGSGKSIYVNSLNDYNDEDLIIINNNFYNNFRPIIVKKNQTEDFHIYSNFFLDYTPCKNDFIPELRVCDEEREFFIPYGFTPATSGLWYVVDEYPLQCANGWDGEDSVCSRAKYETEDLSAIAIDAIGTAERELLKIVGIMVISFMILALLIARRKITN